MTQTFGTIVNPADSPDEANSAVDAIISRGPVILPPPPSGEVVLLAGIIGPDGIVRKDARVRELNGADEERIARSNQGGIVVAPEKFINMVLTGNVEEIGGTKPDQQVLLSLLLGDRNHLALEIRKLTFGNDWAIEGMICRHCQEPFDVVVELDKDVKYQKWDQSNFVIEVPLRHDRVAEVRLVTGADQLAAIGDGKRTVAEQTSTYIERCLRSIDGSVPPAGISKTMGLGDRSTIIKALSEKAPGPRLDSVAIPCGRCGREADYAIGIVDIFRN